MLSGIRYSLSVEPVIVPEALLSQVFKIQVKVFRINPEFSILSLTFHRLSADPDLGPNCLHMLSAESAR